MTSDAILGLVSGVMVLAASFAVGTHEILLSPDRPNYPDGSRHQRVLMFIWSGVLLYRGVEMLGGALSERPPTITLGIFMGSFMVMAVHAILLEEQAKKWLPARVHARIRHLLNIATCGRSNAIRRERERQNRTPQARPGFTAGSTDPAITAAALVQLSQEGARVIGPLEGVEALLEEPFIPTRKS